MSARRELERRLAGLQEIRDIMNSMKSLALMEAHKLDRIMDNQHALVATIEAAARDFLGSHPIPGAHRTQPPAVRLVIGGERGFCGDFNESLLASEVAGLTNEHILVGRKLWSRTAEDAPARAALDGASVAEDVDGVLGRIVASINAARAGREGVTLVVRYHDREGDVPVERTLIPPWQPGASVASDSRVPPLINLSPQKMLHELVDHYLYAALQEILLASLRAENHRRARHLNGAVSRLDERLTELKNRCRQLRQEEITEEIEVILLGAT